MYADPEWALRSIVPVVLPGRSATEFPDFLASGSETWFPVPEFTVAGPSPEPPDSADPPPAEIQQAADAAARLADLTLLDGTVPDQGLLLHPWIGDALLRRTPHDDSWQQERAVALRLRRFQLGRAGYPDLLDLPRHLAARHRYDDIVAIASQGAQARGGGSCRRAGTGTSRGVTPAAVQRSLGACPAG